MIAEIDYQYICIVDGLYRELSPFYQTLLAEFGPEVADLWCDLA